VVVRGWATHAGRPGGCGSHDRAITSSTPSSMRRRTVHERPLEGLPGHASSECGAQERLDEAGQCARPGIGQMPGSSGSARRAFSWRCLAAWKWACRRAKSDWNSQVLPKPAGAVTRMIGRLHSALPPPRPPDDPALRLTARRHQSSRPEPATYPSFSASTCLPNRRTRPVWVSHDVAVPLWTVPTVNH